MINICKKVLGELFLGVNPPVFRKRVLSNLKFGREVRIVSPRIIPPRNRTMVSLNDTSLLKLIYHLSSIAWF